MCAAAFDRTNLFDLLLSKGARVNDKSDTGLTPLVYSIYALRDYVSFDSTDHTVDEAISRLIAAGADVNATC